MTKQPDSYAEVRNDLDGLMGDVHSASLLMTFIVMRETEVDGTDLSPDFVGALWSVQNLLASFRSQGDAMVHRMMALEPNEPETPNGQVQS